MTEIKGVEIFSVGTWNGNSIKPSDLEDMVAAFKATSETFKPVLKLGHDDEQKLLQSEGLPAAGWISDLYVKGDKLLADFSDIPKKVFELIKRKAYRKVSSEIYSGITLGGKKFSRLLGAVALLGADTPAVMNLSDILSQYKKSIDGFTGGADKDNILIESYSYSPLEVSMPDPVVNKNPQDDKIADVVSKQADQISAQKAEIEKYKQEKEAAEAKVLEIAKAKEEAEVKAFCSTLEAEKLVSPSMKPIIEGLLNPAVEKFSVGDKSLDRKEAMKELLKLSKECFSVNTETKTQEGKKKEGDTEKALEAEIEKYAAENKVSYRDAYTIITKAKEA